MKVIKWVAVVVLALALTEGARAAEMKVAVVNAGALLKQYYKTARADAQFQDQVEEFGAERDKLLAEHRRLKKEFEQLRAESQSKAFSEDARDKRKVQAEEKLTQVVEYENNIRDLAQSRRKQLEDDGRRMQKKLLGEIQDIVQAYAKTNGFALVLDSSGPASSALPTVLFADEKLDITDAVLKILNAGKDAATEKR